MSSLSDNYLSRFSGIARLYGRTALQRFAQAHVCVIGIGGVGSWAAEALARSGIGQITLIDMDDICVTNSNRQLPAMHSTIGQLKTAVMAQRIKDINPECVVHCIDDFITAEDLTLHIDNRFDYIIDAIDDVRAKAALIAYCRRSKIPIVTTCAAGGKKDPTQIQLSDLAKTLQDPLAVKLRDRLKRHFKISKNSRGKLGITCVFSSEPFSYPQKDGSVCHTKQQADGVLKMDCAAGFGSVTMVTASFGFIAVSHVLQKLTPKSAC